MLTRVTGNDNDGDADRILTTPHKEEFVSTASSCLYRHGADRTRIMPFPRDPKISLHGAHSHWFEKQTKIEIESQAIMYYFSQMQRTFRPEDAHSPF